MAQATIEVVTGRGYLDRIAANCDTVAVFNYMKQHGLLWPQVADLNWSLTIAERPLPSTENYRGLLETSLIGALARHMALQDGPADANGNPPRDTYLQAFAALRDEFDAAGVDAETILEYACEVCPKGRLLIPSA